MDAAGGRLSHDAATELPVSVSPALPPGSLLKEPERSDFSDTLGPPWGLPRQMGLGLRSLVPQLTHLPAPEGVPRRHSSRQHGASCPCWGWGGGREAPHPESTPWQRGRMLPGAAATRNGGAPSRMLHILNLLHLVRRHPACPRGGHQHSRVTDRVQGEGFVVTGPGTVQAGRWMGVPAESLFSP